MKRLMALLLAVLMITGCLFAVACKTPDDGGKPDPQPPADDGGNEGDGGSEGDGGNEGAGGSEDDDDNAAPAYEPRMFLAGYERLVATESGEPATLYNRVVLNLNADGTLDAFVCFLGGTEHKTAHYTGTYSFGVNDENDETITFTYVHGDTTEKHSDVAIIDGMFGAPFYLIDMMTANDVKFFESDPIALEGEVFAGHRAKDSAMGNMVYAYVAVLKADGTFTVSIMQMAGATMHIVGKSEGTYVIDGESITFTYDVSDGEGGVAKEDHVSEGTAYNGTSFSVGFNIAQATVAASPSVFIKLK